MPSWNDIVMEVMKRKEKGQKTDLLSAKEPSVSCVKKNHKKTKVRSLAVYRLGTKYGNLYFTKREAECMVWLLKGKTIGGIAKKLNLSPRTVEYYIKNMKTKVGCRTKFELIDLVHDSDFTKNIDF